MSQSTKDSSGGKTHAKKATHGKSSASEETVKKSGNQRDASPTGPMRHGEKKTTP